MNEELLTGSKNDIETKNKPKLGFLGTGWIGKNRMEGIYNSGYAEIMAVSDLQDELMDNALNSCPDAGKAQDLDELLENDIDGIVIATPSALHAEQSIKALNAGKAVFCQKPLGRDADEVKAVIDAAKKNDKLLGVDFSYRYLRSAGKVREIIQSGELGKIFAADLVFHNAYGPDKDWFYNPKESGGGCLIDLGVHLVDLGLWMLKAKEIKSIKSSLFAKGEKLTDTENQVEDYAAAMIGLEQGVNLNLACSWNLNAGQDAIIEASFYGSEGGISIKNVNGSFYDFEVKKFKGTQTEILDEPPDEWGPRAAVDWAKKLNESSRYDSEIESIIIVSEVIDKIYNR